MWKCVWCSKWAWLSLPSAGLRLCEFHECHGQMAVRQYNILNQHIDIAQGNFVAWKKLQTIKNVATTKENVIYCMHFLVSHVIVRKWTFHAWSLFVWHVHTYTSWVSQYVCVRGWEWQCSRAFPFSLPLGNPVWNSGVKSLHDIATHCNRLNHAATRTSPWRLQPDKEMWERKLFWGAPQNNDMRWDHMYGEHVNCIERTLSVSSESTHVYVLFMNTFFYQCFIDKHVTDYNLGSIQTAPR